MKKLNIGIILACALVFCLSSCRQQSTSSKVLLNEICMENVDGVVNDYGQHTPWIELFVKYYGPIDVAGYAVEVEVDGKTTRYTIPTGDIATKIQPRQHILLWADNNDLHGTLHTNFTLDPGKTTTVRLYNSNKDLIDEVTIPANSLSADQSYGRDGALYSGNTTDAWKVFDHNDHNNPTTAGVANVVVDSTAKMRNFETQDPVGIGMTITAMIVVFGCLFLLYNAFSFIGKLSMKMAKKNELKAKGVASEAAATAAASTADKDYVPGEVYAAIGMALHEMQNDVHDMEEMVLTIDAGHERTLSPWNAKSITMRQTPHRK